MKTLHFFNSIAKVVLATAAVGTYLTVSAVTWPNIPLGATTSATPITMLVASKDHKLFYEAYNDVTDLDGDDNLDIRFVPDIPYYGLFDSDKCYKHSNGDTNNDLFEPISLATIVISKRGKPIYKCPGNWSGNWLNYVTTSRIDALRKVLYGGYREKDVNGETILRRAYIPQDTHSWAKEYTSEEVDGYNINDFTPLSPPNSGRRHFFGNVTMVSGTNCSTLSNCTSKPPFLSVVTNSPNRVWDWASSESPVLNNNTHGGTRKNYTVRVKACAMEPYTDCKQYGSNWKPVGLLHEYGEDESMYFGLLTGSYNRNMSGGVLRKTISSFRDEIDTSTGIFKNNAPIVKNFNALAIRDYNNGSTDSRYRGGSFRTGPMHEGAYVDWGNPVGEMMYEALRYLAGAKSATGVFGTSGSHDNTVGLTTTTWNSPYENTGDLNIQHCSRPNMLVMSDSYPSYDGDQVPGSPYAGSMSADTKLPGFNAKSLLDTISDTEGSKVKGLRFVGQSTTSNLDYAPSAKNVTSLAYVRGLSPEEPAKLGSYTSAAVAYYAKKNGFAVPGSPEKAKVDSFFVTFSSPTPTIEFTIQGQKVSIVPFAKTINGISTDRKQGAYQPTNPIVDVYVRKIINTTTENQSSENGGRPLMEFNIIYEADEQGNDFDMDVDSLYTLSETADGELEVKVQLQRESTGSNQNIGYVISGTNRDGIYLVTQDKPTQLDYFLNTPPNTYPGYCIGVTSPKPSKTKYDACRQLPYLNDEANPIVRQTSTEKFTLGSTNAGFLKDPLWYAAKYGGFSDRNNNGTPDLSSEWDQDGDGVPDSYFLVQNPLKLREALKKAFDGILERSGSGGNIIANSTVLSTDSLVYQGTYNSENWSGDLVAYPVTNSGVSSTPAWKASEQLPSPSTRKIYYGSQTPSGTFVAKNFIWSYLTTDEAFAYFNNDEDLLNYVRGVRTKEERNGGTLRSRSINNVLGDISHSAPFYVKETNTVYIGANDGMLHGFDAATGEEQFAYIPKEVMGKLKSLSDLDYKTSHKYFVDGDMVVTSTGQTGGSNYLVGTLGRGGKGLFGLDVSDPDNFEADDVKWEYTPSASSTAASDADLGYMLGRPVLGKMKNGDMAVLVGNGYNSSNEKAVLYVIRVSDGQILAKLDTGVAGDNGLAPPGLRVNSDTNEVEYAYAGDLHGNVWKFDLTSSSPSEWTVSPTPLFKAIGPDGKAQPITAPMNVIQNTVVADANYGKWFIHFGTGSDFRTNDPSDLSVQSWYGLIDEGSTITRSELVSRKITEEGTVAGRPVRVFEEAKSGDMTGKKGWYIDLKLQPSGPEEGERIVTKSNYYKLVEPTLLVSSVIPVEDVCTPGGRGFLNAVNPFTGGRLNQHLFDLNEDGQFTNADGLGGNAVSSIDLGVGKPGEAILVGNRLVVGGSDDKREDVRVNLGVSPFKGRLSWREIILN